MTPTHALVLAAGFGTRMRPLTNDRPKALVEVAGRTLLDHAIHRLVLAGVRNVVVNVHYMADMVEAHLARTTPAMLSAMGARAALHVSDERAGILETGGGVKAALPLLGDAPFLVTNVDSHWDEAAHGNLAALAAAGLDGARARLLLARRADCIGFDGKGDFSIDARDRLRRRGTRETVPHAYSGTLITQASALADMPPGAWSLNKMFDAALAENALLGHPMQGTWMHIGTPEAVGEAEAALSGIRDAGA